VLLTCKLRLSHKSKFFHLFSFPIELLIISQFLSPTVGKKVKLTVTSNYDFPAFHSIVIGRTGVIHNATHKPKDGATTYTFSFKATPWMMPKASVIVYFTHRSGELVYDRVELNFKHQLPNDVSFYQVCISFVSHTIFMLI